MTRFTRARRPLSSEARLLEVSGSALARDSESGLRKQAGHEIQKRMQRAERMARCFAMRERWRDDSRTRTCDGI